MFINKKNINIFGIIPARMAASRFPGKPLKKICDVTMIEHVYRRACMFKKWKNLLIATCDNEIKNFLKKKFPVIMTSKKHKRCLTELMKQY